MSTDDTDLELIDAIASLAAKIEDRALPIMSAQGIPPEDHADVLLALAEVHRAAVADGDDGSSADPLGDPVELAALIEEAWAALRGAA